MSLEKIKSDKHTGITAIIDDKPVKIAVTIELLKNPDAEEYVLLVTPHTDWYNDAIETARSKDFRVMLYKFDLLSKFIKERKIYSETNIKATVLAPNGYRLYFSAPNGLQYKSHKNWETQLYCDILRKLCSLDGWEYKTLNGLKERFKFIVGHNTTFSNEKKYLIRLNSPVYGKQVRHMVLPGMATGYVDFGEIEYQLKIGEPTIRIPVENFYDIRSNAKSLFHGAFLVIERKA